MATADDEYAFLEAVEQQRADGDGGAEAGATALREEGGKEGGGGSRERERSRKSSREDRDRRRRRSRSRSRDRLVRRRDRSRERWDGDRGERARERERRDQRSPPRRRERTPPEVRAARERERELRELDRDTRTVFAYNLNLRAEERDLFALFSSAGPLVDIKIIRDKNSGRSKGFAYIEYEQREDVINALALTGQVLMGQAVMVKMSEAEKNLAWEAAEQQKAAQKALEAQLGSGAMVVQPPPAGPYRLFVANLHPSIAEGDLRPVFEPFGTLDYVALQRDALGRSTGVAYVQFRSLAEGSKAMESLDGMDLVGQQIKVGPAEAASQATAGMAVQAPVAAAVQEQLDADADDGGGLKLTSQARAALMSRLASNAGLVPPALPAAFNPLAPPMAVQPQVPAAVVLEQGLLGPASPIATQCLLLKNMFDPAEEIEPNWDQDIAGDVKEECEKYGAVQHIYVDKESQGFVYLKFSSVEGAAAAQRALHGRWFAGRQVVADFQFTPVYTSFFKV